MNLHIIYGILSGLADIVIAGKMLQDESHEKMEFLSLALIVTFILFVINAYILLCLNSLFRKFYDEKFPTPSTAHTTFNHQMQPYYGTYQVQQQLDNSDEPISLNLNQQFNRIDEL